jgi:aldehyde dehydrogenase (NAD+)
LITSVHAASSRDVDLAVTAARAAFNNPSWRDMKGRASLLYKLADLAEANAELFATVDTWNNGKPYKSALGDISELASVCRYYAGFADKMYGQTIETSPQKLAYTIREPLGVCGQIIP